MADKGKSKRAGRSARKPSTLRYKQTDRREANKVKRVVRHNGLVETDARLVVRKQLTFGQARVRPEVVQARFWSGVRREDRKAAKRAATLQAAHVQTLEANDVFGLTELFRPASA